MEPVALHRKSANRSRSARYQADAPQRGYDAAPFDHFSRRACRFQAVWLLCKFARNQGASGICRM
jgi:hypothetical protein